MSSRVDGTSAHYSSGVLRGAMTTATAISTVDAKNATVSHFTAGWQCITYMYGSTLRRVQLFNSLSHQVAANLGPAQFSGQLDGFMAASDVLVPGQGNAVQRGFPQMTVTGLMAW